jgi:GDP-mannose 6-dehydrogenase
MPRKPSGHWVPLHFPVMSSISIFGLGYVGSVSAACFARLGHQVTGVDVSPAKVEMLQSGQSPIIEAQMDDLVAEAHSSGRLRATTNSRQAIDESEVSFICVGTPSLRNGKLDLSHVEHVCREIGAALREKLGEKKGKKRHHVVVLRSTVLPGTTETVVIPALQSTSGLRAGADFTVCYNPEFLREGTAVADFLEPPYTILGANAVGTNILGPRETAALAPVRQLYAGIPAAVFETTTTVAEMVKYVSNAFHAVKVGFANEIGTLCKNLDVDTEAITRIFTSDTKLNISPAYLSPGFAFGGSCLPKDLRALAHRAKELDLSLPLLESVMPSNADHMERAVEMILQTGRIKIALLGLSFKAATDDLRGSPQVELVKRLLGEGRQVKIWDQHVSLGRLVGSNRQYIEEFIPHIGSLLYSNLEEAVAGAEVVIVGTTELKRDDLRLILKPEQIVIDLVNLAKSQRPDGGASYEGICW